MLWTTTYMGDALDALRAEGYPVTDDAVGHLTPAQHDHINFYGTYHFDVESELRRQDTDRYVHQPPELTAPAKRDQIRSVTKETPICAIGVCS